MTKLLEGGGAGGVVQRVVSAGVLSKAAAIAESPPLLVRRSSGGEDPFPVQRVISQATLDAATAVLTAVPSGVHGGRIVVVPDNVSLGPGNDAITIKKALHVHAYKRFVENSEAGYESPALRGAVRDAIDINTILVKENVLAAPDILMKGTIWHELGHVLHGAPENGLVFLHELSMLRQHFGDDATRTYVTDVRTLKYLKSTAVEPGLAELKGLLEALGFNDTPGASAAAGSAAAGSAQPDAH